MKQIAIIFSFILISLNINAQKFFCVDTKYILENIPEYTSIQKKLDDLAETWQDEIDKDKANIEEMYKKYQAEAIVLPDEIKQQREEEIIKKENELRELQKKRFGSNGDLYNKRIELVKPLQDKIYNAIKGIVEKGGFSFVFDKASQMSILYADDKFDKSNEVLQAMGVNVTGN